MTRRFTGRHMVVVLVAFFGVIIAVNLYMASLAVGRFGGTVVDNSYVASQRYNDWIAESRAQEARGWAVDVSVDGEGHVLIAAPDTGMTSIEAVAEHPTRRALDEALTLVPAGSDLFRSDAPLPSGRWTIRSEIKGAEATGRFLHDVRAP